jgi:hypothetical protein
MEGKARQCLVTMVTKTEVGAKGNQCDYCKLRLGSVG